MGSHQECDNNSNANGAALAESQIQTQTDDPELSLLGREGSNYFYSLTLDEVQNQLGDLGKPLSSMNLDELLKSVFTTDHHDQTNNQTATTTVGGIVTDSEAYLNQNGRQSSLTLLSRNDLSKKTVDEVWQSIQEEELKNSSASNNLNLVIDQKSTLGEMTLEDFLVKAGVVAGESSSPQEMKDEGLVFDPMMSLTQQQPPPPQWMTNYPIPNGIHSQYAPQQTGFIPAGHHLAQQNILHPVGLEAQLTISSDETHQAPRGGRKRVAPSPPDDVMIIVAEKSTVERRQKRMIKNRESAARSRARKQAYTQELENKVSRLEEENERLKKQKEWEKALPNVPPTPQPKCQQLRRTSSAPM